MHCNVLTESRHVKSNVLSGVLQSTLRGLRYCEMQGDINQQGGAFILGPGRCMITLCPLSLQSTRIHCVWYTSQSSLSSSDKQVYCSEVYSAVFWYLWPLNIFRLALVFLRYLRINTREVILSSSKELVVFAKPRVTISVLTGDLSPLHMLITVQWLHYVDNALWNIDPCQSATASSSQWMSSRSTPASS